MFGHLPGHTHQQTYCSIFLLKKRSPPLALHLPPVLLMPLSISWLPSTTKLFKRVCMLSIPNFSLPILSRTPSTRVNISSVSLNKLLLRPVMSSVLPNLEVFSWSSSNLAFQHPLIVYHSLFLGTLFFPLILGTSCFWLSSYLPVCYLPLSFTGFLTLTQGSVLRPLLYQHSYLSNDLLSSIAFSTIYVLWPQMHICILWLLP